MARRQADETISRDRLDAAGEGEAWISPSMRTSSRRIQYSYQSPDPDLHIGALHVCNP